MNELNLQTVDKIFNQINGIITTKEELRRLQGEYHSLTQPMLHNAEHLPQILQWYEEVSSDAGLNSRDAKAMYSQCFIFIVTMLYSPSTLAGGKLSLGLRSKLSQMLNFKSPTSISNIIPNLMFLYKSYKSFKNRVDTAFDYIFNKLKSQNLL